MHHLIPRSRGRSLLQAAGDLVAGLAAFGGALLLRIHLPLPLTQFPLPAERIAYFFSEWWVLLASQALTLYFFGFYDPPRSYAGSDRARRLLTATALQGLGLMAYYFLANREFPRSVLLLFVGLNFALLFAWRSLVERPGRAPHRRVAIIGSGSAARELAAKIRRLGPHGLVLAGHVPSPEEGGTAAAAAAELGPCLGSVDDLPALLAAGRLDDLILAARTPPWQTQLLDRLAAGGNGRTNVLLLPGPLESLIGRMRYRWVEDLPLIEVVRQTEWRMNRPLKRLFDLAAGSLLLLATLPLLAVCAAAVALTSRGPVLYRQTRVGRGQRHFTLWKLRTMHRDAEEATGEVLASPNDPRLTPVGAVLRGLRLDELPQLLNVLAGSMSLVGPRPERPGFVARYLAEVPGYSERFSVPPGVTGLAQINGEYHSSAENKLRYDLAYIANWSPWLDLVILLRTVKIIFTSRGV